MKKKVGPRKPDESDAEGKLERLLLEGLNSGPMTSMTEKDWAELRAQLKMNWSRGKLSK